MDTAEENTEIIIPKKPSNWKRALLATLIAVAVVSSWFFLARLYSDRNDEKERELKEMGATVADKNSIISSLNTRNDSLARANARLYGQRQLTEVMTYRDSVIAAVGIPAPGTLVVVLPKGDTAVVASVVAGGDRFENYLKCQIRKADGTYETITPNLLIRVQ